MPVTSDTLFHFTRSLANLNNIVINRFYLTYCKEEFFLGGSRFVNYIPMITFCDLPLSLAKDHISKYGNYGIGMSKDWGIRHRLNPVLYLERNSIIAADMEKSRLEFKKTMDTILAAANSGKYFPKSLLPLAPQLVNSWNYYRNTLRFIKNYRGDLIRGSKTYIDYRFYDEREWRFIPGMDDIRIKPSITHQEYTRYRGTSKIKPLIKSINIPFLAEDIKFLIVKSSKDIPRILKTIKSTRTLTANQDSIDILATKIITVEQLNHDF